MRARLFLLAVFFSIASSPALAQWPTFSSAVKQYELYDSPKIVLTHVRVIDGTGAPAVADQNVTIENGKITAITPGADVPAAQGVTVVDLRGATVLPGIVGMHEHLYNIALPDTDVNGGGQPPLLLPQMTFSSPLLYLAAGVTTMRTGGSVEPYADLNLRDQINAGKLPGPHIDVTGPYLEGKGSPFIQMHQLADAGEARTFVDYWADRGVTSFKAYMFITRAELKAAIDESHKRGIKITGHLCSVTYREAAEMGIDNLEHGFEPNTEHDTGKAPDVCPTYDGAETLAQMDPDGAEAKSLFEFLIAHHVALTSTLAVFESDVPGRPPLRQDVLDAMSPPAREAYLYSRLRELSAHPKVDFALAFRHELAMERNFVKAGGFLMAGCDPTGDGGVLPGFGDQREIELLVDAGFTPVEAIRIATLNGATYMGKQSSIGSIAAGKNADLLVVDGDPSAKISDIENVRIVFKDGIAFDPAKLLAAARGRYGQY
ncbi:MAG: amidohydrolase family protein [Candidatus Acidiferrales bacterium]|jgi:imidazolonepropionase-like amidohydrolase